MNSKTLRIFIYVCLILYFSLFFLRKINLTTADLGRHIINGRVFVEQGKVVSSNFYSYTQPDFPVVTHHWLSGVVFYFVQNISGFSGLSLFYILISGLTVFLFFKISMDRSNLGTALLVTVIMMPLLSDRLEIRPEGFSYLLMGTYYYLAYLYTKKKIGTKVLFSALSLLQVLWVNLHLFFITGILIIAVFAFAEGIKKWFYKRNNKFNELVVLATTLTLLSLANPYTITGLLEPLNILKEYGYMIVENQSVFFMQKRSPDFIYFFFELLAVSMVFISAHILLSKKLIRHTAPLLLSWAFLILGFRAIRGMQIFGLFFVPLAAGYLHDYFDTTKNKLLLPAIFFVFITLIPGHVFSMVKPGAGIGLVEGVNGSAKFFKENGLEGPIFNNYDIGGYLIYHLYDQEKVFVDNRPEAYSVSFFDELYNPMQAEQEIWQKALEEYNFNVIYFYRRDRTQHAQPFLIERIKDPEWVPVYVDLYTLILVRNNEQNQAIINNYQIPPEVFRVT